MNVSGGHLDQSGLGVCCCSHVLKFPRVSLTFRSNNSFRTIKVIYMFQCSKTSKSVSLLGISHKALKSSTLYSIWSVGCRSQYMYVGKQHEFIASKKVLYIFDLG